MGARGLERSGQPVLFADEGFGGTRHRATAQRADIQGLRAVAVVLVLLDHVFGFPSGGYIGVDVFFVISGYLITGLLVREVDRSGRISIREFYARRARRILPMAVLVLVVTNIGARLIFLSSRAHESLVDSLWAFGFLANVRFASIGADYFETNRAPSVVQQYWSLAVEEQFYVVWPCIVLLTFLIARRLRVRSATAVAVVSAVVTLASFLYSASYTPGHPTSSYFSTPARAWELGLGAFMVCVQGWFSRIAPRTRAAVSWSALGAIVLAALIYSETTPFPGTAALLPVAATALILAVGEAPGGPGEWWALGSRPAQFTGRISYSLYLWHWPVLILANAVYGDGSAVANTLGVVGAFWLATITAGLVEEPIRHSLWLSRKPVGYAPPPRRRLSEWVDDNQRLFASISAAALVGAVALAWGALAADAPRRTTVAFERATVSGDEPLGDSTNTTTVLDPLAQRIRASLAAPSWGELNPSLDNLEKSGAPEMLRDNCLTVNERNKTRCRYGPAAAPKLAVVVGDSMAASFVPGLRSALEPEGWRLQLLTRHGCAIIDARLTMSATARRVDNECIAHDQWVYGEVQRLQPQLVFISGEYDAVNALADGGPPNSAQNFAVYRDGMNSAIGKMSSPGRRIALVTQPPPSKNLQECVTRVSNPSDCSREIDSLWYRVRAADQAIAAASGAVYVDPSSWVCYRGTCPAVIGDTPVYWDGSHFTAVYARSLAPQLRGALTA